MQVPKNLYHKFGIRKGYLVLVRPFEEGAVVIYSTALNLLQKHGMDMERQSNKEVRN